MDKQHGEKITISEAIRQFRRNQPQVYRIMVAGRLDQHWSDRLGGLRIEPLSDTEADQPITILQGLIKDQSQLSGVLNTLCDLRLSLVGIELVENDPTQQT